MAKGGAYFASNPRRLAATLPLPLCGAAFTNINGVEAAEIAERHARAVEGASFFRRTPRF
jgi:hypothetical protein